MSAPYSTTAFDPRAPGQMPPQHAQGQSTRTGLVGWWLNLTAPRLPDGILPRQEAERLRKAELTSLSIIPVLVLLIALVSNSLASPATAMAVVVMAVVLAVAAVFNRIGFVRTAAYLIPGGFGVLIAMSVLAAPGLRVIGLPIFDLFALPIFIVSLTGDRRAPWGFAAAAIAFIVLDYLYQPHALITGHGATNFDDLAFEQAIFGLWGMINRHIALAFFAAFFGWLGARSVDEAIARADRAEEVAALEHAVSQQRRQLEIGVQQILETHVRVANGDFTTRAPMSQDNVLWQIAASLNNLLGRLQKAGQAEHQMRRVEDEMRRLIAAIDDAQAGRRPIWPAKAGTIVDELIDRIRRPSPGAADAPGRSIRPADATSIQSGRLPSAGTMTPASAFPTEDLRQGGLDESALLAPGQMPPWLERMAPPALKPAEPRPPYPAPGGPPAQTPQRPYNPSNPNVPNPWALDE